MARSDTVKQRLDEEEEVDLEEGKNWVLEVLTVLTTLELSG